jgi:dCMP deaminase
MDKWDIRFLKLAEHISKWSKDPSTQVGAVITNGKRIISTGFNGFSKGVNDTEDRYSNRDFKYPAVIHAEVNAILFAKQDLCDCTIYTYPMPPCARCASMIIQAGIKRIVAISPSNDQLSRWEDDFLISSELYKDVGMNLEFITMKHFKNYRGCNYEANNK